MWERLLKMFLHRCARLSDLCLKLVCTGISGHTCASCTKSARQLKQLGCAHGTPWPSQSTQFPITYYFKSLTPSVTQSARCLEEASEKEGSVFSDTGPQVFDQVWTLPALLGLAQSVQLMVQNTCLHPVWGIFTKIPVGSLICRTFVSQLPLGTKVWVYIMLQLGLNMYVRHYSGSKTGTALSFVQLCVYVIRQKKQERGMLRNVLQECGCLGLRKGGGGGGEEKRHIMRCLRLSVGNTAGVQPGSLSYGDLLIMLCCLLNYICWCDIQSNIFYTHVYFHAHSPQ